MGPAVAVQGRADGGDADGVRPHRPLREFGPGLVTALIFDCDGVLSDTERHGHLPAFNETFAELGLPVHWSEEEYADKLLIGGGKERMARLLTPSSSPVPGFPGTRTASRSCWGPGTCARRRSTRTSWRKADSPAVQELQGSSARRSQPDGCSPWRRRRPSRRCSPSWSTSSALPRRRVPPWCLPATSSRARSRP